MYQSGVGVLSPYLMEGVCVDFLGGWVCVRSGRDWGVLTGCVSWLLAYVTSPLTKTGQQTEHIHTYLCVCSFYCTRAGQQQHPVSSTRRAVLIKGGKFINESIIKRSKD